jgi:hypothetical protein
MFQVRHNFKQVLYLDKTNFFGDIYLQICVCHILFMGLRTWRTVYIGHQLHVQRRSEITYKV